MLAQHAGSALTLEALADPHGGRRPGKIDKIIERQADRVGVNPP
jgi:hypothetical protein